MLALTAGLAPAAYGAPAQPVRPAQPVQAAASGSDGSGNDGGDSGSEGMELARSSRPVAPGTTLTSFDRLNPDKWLRADALTVDLKGSTRFDYLANKVSERKTVTELAKAHDPGKGRRTVAAINADFFDINETGAPLSPGVRDGKLVQSPAPGNSEVVGIGPASAGRILDLYFDGTVTLPGGEQPLASYNAANVPKDGIGVYNAQWGAADRALTANQASTATEVTLRDGKVVSVSDKPGKGEIPQGTTVLIGRDAAAGTLAELEAGDAVSVAYDVRTDDGSEVPRTAVGGRGVLVENGKPQDWEGLPNNATAPRTAVGFSKDGSTMHVLTVDGRQAASGGVTLTELARMMHDLGAYNALNLDGGGSSTLIAREPGSDATQVENAPSDGQEREVPNGLALTAPDGSGRLKGFWVETEADAAQAPTADNVPGGHPERVFPGLTRQLTAAGHDETYGPAEGSPRWYSHNDHVGRVDQNGTFRGRNAGTSKVLVREKDATGSLTMEVLGELDRVRASQDRLGLSGAGDESRIGIIGWDKAGSSAPISPADVELRYDRSLFSVTPDPVSGGFTVTARADNAAGQVSVTVAGHTTVFGVTSGLRDEKVADFEDAAAWKFSAARAEGALSAEAEGKEGGALKLDYDFTQSTATRAAYASPPGKTPVPGQPQSFSMWLKGDGKGAWPSLELTDANGTNQVLRGAHVEWQGWKKVTFAVPEGTSYPLSVRRFYLAETRATEQYRSSVVVDELAAQNPPELELPKREAVRDPLISTASDVSGRDWRFAVMSDAQFVARDPDSDIVRQARRTLREIRKSEPDFLIINGDLVDEGSPADLKFARTVLEEELGDAVPWYYVPGNHEIMGGKIDNFEAEFGPAHRTFDHKGTRFITLDTSKLTLRGGGYEQIAELRAQLDAARKDHRVRSVAVVQHAPPRDPTPEAASRLTDRLEADLLEDWLSDFRERSGKGVMFIGSHVGVFDAARVDGVPYLINGNSGKGPAAPAGEGGFTGWSTVGVDRNGGSPFAVQTRAHVDGLALEAPTQLRVGASGEAAATVHQGTGEKVRKVPVGWPVSADWAGSRNLCIKGERHDWPPCAASYDPVTGKLTALREGTVTLEVKVNGALAEREIVVRR